MTNSQEILLFLMLSILFLKAEIWLKYFPYPKFDSVFQTEEQKIKILTLQFIYNV